MKKRCCAPVRVGGAAEQWKFGDPTEHSELESGCDWVVLRNDLVESIVNPPQLPEDGIKLEVLRHPTCPISYPTKYHYLQSLSSISSPPFSSSASWSSSVVTYDPP